MVGESFDPIGLKYLCEVHHLGTSHAVDDTTLTWVGQDEADDISLRLLGLWLDAVKQVRTIERALEDCSGLHPQVLHDVMLHLRGCRGRKSHDGSLCNLHDDGAYATILRSEVMSPL